MSPYARTSRPHFAQRHGKFSGCTRATRTLLVFKARKRALQSMRGDPGMMPASSSVLSAVVGCQLPFHTQAFTESDGEGTSQ